jgi:hypothetical protein
MAGRVTVDAKYKLVQSSNMPYGVEGGGYLGSGSVIRPSVRGGVRLGR